MAFVPCENRGDTPQMPVPVGISLPSHDYLDEEVRRATSGGQGTALKSGIAYAIERNRNLLGVVTTDADGQHAPRDIVRVA